jgi:hypothetical protein
MTEGYNRIKIERKYMTQEQVLLRIRTAVNIATGDDGHTGEKVLDIFVKLCGMTDKEYQKEVEYYG